MDVSELVEVLLPDGSIHKVTRAERAVWHDMIRDANHWLKTSAKYHEKRNSINELRKLGGLPPV